MSVSTSPPRLPHLARLAKHRPPVIQSQTATHNVALLLYALTARGRVGAWLTGHVGVTDCLTIVAEF